MLRGGNKGSGLEGHRGWDVQKALGNFNLDQASGVRTVGMS